MGYYADECVELQYRIRELELENQDLKDVIEDLKAEIRDYETNYVRCE